VSDVFQLITMVDKPQAQPEATLSAKTVIDFTFFRPTSRNYSDLDIHKKIPHNLIFAAVIS